VRAVGGVRGVVLGDVEPGRLVAQGVVDDGGLAERDLRPGRLDYRPAGYRTMPGKFVVNSVADYPDAASGTVGLEPDGYEIGTV
jgi:hypothetical protein